MDVNGPLKQLRARQALKAAGVEEGSLERATSVNNEVWLGTRHVVRLNGSKSSRLRREVFVSDYLPSTLNYPRLVAYGGEVGADYLIQERKPGRPLAHIWHSMSDATRRQVITQLGEQLKILHTTPTPRQMPEAGPQLIGATDPPTALLTAAIEKARSLAGVDKQVLTDIARVVADYADALVPYASSTLVHGDLTFENLLWDGHTLTILDYEFTRGAPPDADLDVFLRCCALPQLHVGEAFAHTVHAKDYAFVPRWLNEVYPELFAAPQCGRRLLLYAIAFDVRELLAFPPTSRDMGPHHPMNRLRETAEGRSYIARFAAAVSRG